MFGDVEVRDTQGEVDRVDVVERRRQEEQVRRQEDHRERRNGFLQERETKPDGDGVPR
jgi:hypothetical protein